MIEIKFRAKRIDDTNQFEYGYIRVDGTDVWMHTLDGRVMLVIPETVGQFTGRKDRNGIEIYKDDLLKVWCLPFADAEEEMAKVTWDEKRVGFILLYNNGSYHYFYDVMEVEVVGNIHDTKLEDKK